MYAERDRNFRLDVDGEPAGIIKISNTDADPVQLEFQLRALAHIAARDPKLPVPRILPTVAGKPILRWSAPGGEQFMVRMLSWLPGHCIDLATAPAPARQAAGSLLGRLGRALQDCDPSGAPQDLPWNLANTGQLGSLGAFIEEVETAALVRDVLDHFERELLPRFDTLRSQVIHNDLNPDNVLFDAQHNDRTTGVIDFGDMVKAPLICDLAVAGAYQLREASDPVEDLVPLVSGYHRVIPLDALEFELLLPLVACRLLATLLIQGSRAVEHGEHWDLPDSVSGRAARYLQALNAVDYASAAIRLSARCTGSALPR